MSQSAEPISALPRTRRLHVSAGAAFLAMAAQTFFALATYGYLVRVVGAIQVGTWVSLMAVGMLACMADLGLNHALIRQLSLALQGHRHAIGEQALEVIETIVATVAVATGLTLLLVGLSYPWWAGWVSTPTDGAQPHLWIGLVLVGLWLNRLAEALSGALDGQQRFVERSLASAAALLCGLSLTVAVAPHWGMLGFGVAFVVQNALFVALLGRQLRKLNPNLRWMRPRVRLSVLRDALRYGVSVQLLVMCYLVIESSVKLSLAHSGNLAEVTYFDLAFRIAKGVRGLLASALRVLVPRLATGATDAGVAHQRHDAYAKSFAAVQLFSLPIFVTMIAGSRPLSMVLVGGHEPAFVAALGASLVAWLGYSLTDPAMNLSLSSGRMRWPVVGHVVSLALILGTLELGWPAFVGGPHTLGLYVQVTLAILAGCLTTLIGVHHSEGAGWPVLRPLPTLAALGAAAAVSLFSLGVNAVLPDWTASGQWAAIGVVLAVYSAMLWMVNPMGRRIWNALANGFNDGANTARLAAARRRNRTAK